MSTNFKTFLIGGGGGLLGALLFMLVVQNMPQNTVDNQQSYSTQSASRDPNSDDNNDGKNNVGNQNDGAQQEEMIAKIQEDAKKQFAIAEENEQRILNSDPIRLEKTKQKFAGGECDVSDQQCLIQGCPATDIPEKECIALVKLYFSTDGANWTNTLGDDNNWFKTNAACNWYGVSCEGGHVIELLLGDNNLNGPIDPSIGDLSQLEQLLLYNNSLNGSIPSLNNLSKLKTLNLSKNNLIGSIPSLDNLSNLIALYLFSNKLNGSIPSLDSLSKLETLYLGPNELNGSIPSLNKLSNLIALYLGSNKLNGSIPSLNNLSQLKILDISSNNITGPIPPVDNLTNLQYLTLRYNQISGPIPDSITSLDALIELNLDNNKLCGKIPEKFMFTWPSGFPFSYNIDSNKLLTPGYGYSTAMKNWIKAINLQFGLQQSEECKLSPEGSTR